MPGVTVGLPVQSGQHVTHSQGVFKMEPSHHAQCKCHLWGTHMVAQGPAPSTLPLPSPIPIPGPSNTLVPIEECVIPIVEDLPPSTKAHFEGANVNPSTVHHCTIVDRWFGIYCADPNLCSQGLSPRFSERFN